MESGALRGATMGHARVVDDAFTRAVAAHRQALARFAFMLCGDAGHAEDVVAEAYARVWPRWRRRRVELLLGRAVRPHGGSGVSYCGVTMATTWLLRDRHGELAAPPVIRGIDGIAVGVRLNVPINRRRRLEPGFAAA